MTAGGKTGLLGCALAILVGIGAYWLWTGFVLLDPSNIGWLTKANPDPLMHTLGWWFWRDAPWAQWPPGASPRYGIELSGSIALTDSLPLFAFPLKALRPLLPEIQQYWGAWLLVSMTLQALFGYLLARALRASIPVALLAAAFLCFAPPYLYRAQDHMALSGHWLLLAALWLYAIAPRRMWPWVALVVTASLVHAYLLAMVLAIFVGSIVQRARLGYPQLQLLVELVLAFALAGLAMWTAGFFVISSPDAWGLGIFRFNLLSPVDPDAWSRFLSDIPTGYGDYEGFAYLGLGLMILIVVAVLTFALGPLKRVASARWLPLAIVLVLLVLFALGPDIALGPFELVHLPLPAWADKLWSIFRSTGRMAWPAYYLAMVVVIVLVARRMRAWLAVPLVAAALLVQLYDTWPGWSAYLDKRREVTTVWESGLTSPFWDAAAKRYAKIRDIPVREISPLWFVLSSYAATHGLATGAIYLGRMDHRTWQRLDAEAVNAVQTGGFEPDTIYAIDPEFFRWAARWATPDDAFGTVNGIMVFARGGAGLGPMTPYDPAAPLMVPGTKHSGASAKPFLVGSWRGIGSDAEIAVEQRAGIQFQAPGVGQGAMLRLWLRGNTRAPGLPQDVTYSVNGGPPGKVSIPDGESAVVDVPLVSHPDGNYLVDLTISEAEGPYILHVSRDGMPVGLILDSLELLAPN